MVEPLHDADALAALHTACFERPWSGDAFAKLLRGAGVHALGTSQGFIVIRCVADEAEILSLGVVPAARGAGHGRDLVRAAAHLAASAYQVRHIFLEVAANNHAARALYSGLGFICHGSRPRYYANIDAHLMRCDLRACGWMPVDCEKKGDCKL